MFHGWEYEAEHGVQQHGPTDSAMLPAFVWKVTGCNLEMTSTTVLKAKLYLCTSLRHVEE